MRDPLDWLEHEIAALRSSDLWRERRVRGGPQDARVMIDERLLVNFGSNDYLGLASDQRVCDATRRAIDEAGWGAGSSPLVTGYTTAHNTLEQHLAQFEGVESALVFPSGFAANVGAICSLVGRGDAVFGDELNHASLIDGCRLSRAQSNIYPHADLAKLDSLLRESTGAGRRLIVTDSLFSMGGDIAPLPELAKIAQRHGAMLLVDEAHATGVFGQHGRGLCEHFDIEHLVTARVGTLSKALGSVGGFVAGRRDLIEWLANRARPYVFSTALPPAVCAAAIAALDVVREEPGRREELLARAEQLRSRLTADGWNVGRSTSQIIPLIIGEARETMRLSAALAERGMWMPGIRPPSVSEGQSLIRLSLCHFHTPKMLDELFAALRDARENREPA